MISRFGVTIGVVLLSSSLMLGQATAPGRERSHVERFSTPEMRAERAEAIANERLAKNPNDSEALNLRAAARLLFGRYPESYEDLRRAVSLNPNKAEFQANWGYVLWKLGKLSEAVGATRTALKLDDKYFTAQFQLGRFLLRLGGPERLTEAVTHLRQALELEPREYDVRFELIAAYRALDRKAEAYNQLEFLWDSLPSDPRVFYLSGLLATDRDDLPRAIKDFQEALRRDPTTLDGWRDLGLAFVKLKNWSDALAAFNEWSRRAPDSVEAAYLHALALFNSGQVQESEKEARRALRINAGAGEAHTLLGIILASRGNANAEAEEALSQAVALNPDSFDAELYLGRVQFASQNYTGAVARLRKALELNPRHAEARFFLGTALEAAGESEAALVEYQKLAQADPQSAMGQLGLGALLVKQGKTEAAIDALQRAVVLDPKSFEAHWALGRALILAQRFEAAVGALKSAVSIMPQRADAHYQLGLALKRLGRAAEANQEFAIVDRLNTEFRTNSKPKN